MTELSTDFTALAISGRAPSASTLAGKARRWGWWYQAERRLLGMRAYWTSVLGWSVLSPVLYVLAMGLGLGTLVDAGSGGIGGVNYLTFVAPGLLISITVMSATNELMYPVMDGFKWTRLYYSRAATAASPTQVAVGELVAVGIKVAAEAAIFWAVLVSLGAITPNTSWGMIAIAVLAGLAFGAPVMAYSSTLESEGYQFALLQRLVLTPMFLFAGTFYPLETMPAYLQWIGWISPMWHGTQLARAVTYGLPLTAAQIGVHVLFLAALIGIGSWASVRLFRRRLTR